MVRRLALRALRGSVGARGEDPLPAAWTELPARTLPQAGPQHYSSLFAERGCGGRRTDGHLLPETLDAESILARIRVERHGPIDALAKPKASLFRFSSRLTRSPPEVSP